MKLTSWGIGTGTGPLYKWPTLLKLPCRQPKLLIQMSFPAVDDMLNLHGKSDCLIFCGETTEAPQSNATHFI